MTTRSKIHTSITALIALLLILFAYPVDAQGYIAYAHELPFEDTASQPETHSLRLGYIANGMYIEAGPMTGGHSMEMGYKVKKGNWIFKTKYEGEETSHISFFKSKIETEVIYKFGQQHMKQYWRLWAKAIGEKEGTTDAEADKIALIRTVIVLVNFITCFVIIAGNIHNW